MLWRRKVTLIAAALLVLVSTAPAALAHAGYYEHRWAAQRRHPRTRACGGATGNRTINVSRPRGGTYDSRA